VKIKNTCGIWFGRAEDRRLRQRQEDTINMDIKAIVFEDIDTFSWLEIGFSGGLEVTFGVHEKWVIS
jgi:hypothetical protein